MSSIGVGSPAPSPTKSSSSSSNLLSTSTAFSSLPHSSYHYGTDLWDDATSIVDQSEGSKQWFLKLTKFLKEKAELDKEYAKSLKKMVLKLNIQDVTRVQDIPLPPSAAAAAAVQLAANATPQAAAAAPAAPTQANTGITNNEPNSNETKQVEHTNNTTTTPPQIPSVDPRSFDRFMMAFRNLHMTLATNFEILSAKIIEQVMKPIAIHRDAHTIHTKRLLTDLEKYTSAYQKNLDQLLSSRAAYQKACQEADVFRRRFDAASTAGPGGVNSASGTGGNGFGDSLAVLKSDSATLTKKALKADAAYIQSVKTMRGFRMQTDATLSHLLDQFEQLEQSKLTSGKEILSHYLIVQQQMFSSNLKNLSAVQTVLDKVDPHVDLQYFIMLNRSGKLPIPLPEYQVFRGHPNYSKMVDQDSGAAGAQAAPGDLSAFSSAQFEDDDGASSSPVAPLQPAAKMKSGWGWLTNTIANVVTSAGVKGVTHSRTAIDHDSESFLTRGSNYYDKPIEEDEAIIAATPADQHDEENSPERRAIEQQLADMFDAMTGRVSVTSTNATAAPGAPTTSVVSTYSPDRERDLTPEEDILARELFATADGRKSFSSVLNRQRNTSGGLRLSPTALDRLARVTRLFLDEAASCMHVGPAQLVMIMSQSFFTTTPDDNNNTNTSSPTSPNTPNDGATSTHAAASSSSSPSSPPPPKDRRTYLLALIKSHPIWQDMRFWEEAFIEKLRKGAAAKVHKWHSDLEQAESIHTRKQVCFSTLTTFIHNLSEFGVDPRAIVEFAEKLSSINELETEQLMMLRTMPVYEEVNMSDLHPHVADTIQQDRNANANEEFEQIESPHAAQQQQNEQPSTR